MIGGEVARAALRLATLLVLLSGVTILFQEPSSAGSVVAVMALSVSVVFLALVLVLARVKGIRAQARRDNIRPNDYTDADPRTGDCSHGRRT